MEASKHSSYVKELNKGNIGYQNELLFRYASLNQVVNFSTSYFSCHRSMQEMTRVGPQSSLQHQLDTSAVWIC